MPLSGGWVNQRSYRTRVDVLDLQSRFITSAACAIEVQPGAVGWGGVLTEVEPYAHLGSGRHHLRLRGGVEAVIIIQARQRIGGDERYPFLGEGPPPPLEGS
jgi:hypothetical protein